MTVQFAHPGAFVLLALVPVAMLLFRRRPRIAFPAVTELADGPRTPAMRVRWLPAAIRSAALAVLVIAVARPLVPGARRSVPRDGIAIMLVVDRSGSMDAIDYADPADAEMTRLEVVRDVVTRFVVGGGGLPGRPDDLIGLVAFGTFADTIAPLTLDHRHLVRVVQDLEIPALEHERATAIGDGLALAVERLRAIDRATDGERDPRIRSRVVVLLTDGENNAGIVDPVVAADVAGTFGIRVYTIGVGSDRGFATLRSIDPITGRRQRIRASIDEAMLRRIADRTGGRAFLATDRAGLERIYAEIDAMERAPITAPPQLDFHEAAIHRFPLGGRTWPPLVALAVVLIAIESLLRTTRFGGIAE